MSSNITKNSNHENIKEDKNNSINTLSKSFNNCFNKMRYSKKQNYKNTKINSTNNKNNKISNKNNNIQANSLMEYEFLYNDSINKNTYLKQNTNLNKEKDSRNVTNNNNINNQKYKKYFKTYNKSANKDKNNSFNIRKKIISIISKLNQSKDKNNKSIKKNRLKRNLSQKNTLENFLKNMKDHQTKKNEKINNIRKKTLEKEISEMKEKPEISEGSILLLKNIKREPLYQKAPFNEEKKLDTNFKYFYSKNLNIDNDICISPLKSQIIDEKYNKFYESNIKWKKDLEEKNNNKRNNNQEFNEIIENCSFKPKLNKKSINIVDKLIRNKTINYEINNNSFDPENEKEMIDKLRIKLKPILNEYYNNKNKTNYISKKSAFLIRNFSDNNMRKKTYHNYNYKKKQNTNNKNIKLNYKKNEQKYKTNKKEEKKEGEDNKHKKLNLDKKGKDYYLSIKIRQLQKEKADKKKELYKLNIRQGTAWNMETINNIIPKQKCGHIIEGLL